MTQANDINSIDIGNMLLIKDQAVNSWTLRQLGLYQVLWEHPFSIMYHWVPGCDHQASGEVAEFGLVAHLLCNKEADNGCLARWGGDAIAFAKVFHLLKGPIRHLDEALASEAGRPMVVVGLHRTNWNRCFLFKIRRLWWWHIVEDAISTLHEVFEELTSKMSHSWIFEVIFDLELESSNEGAEVMLSPPVKVCFSGEGNVHLIFEVLEKSFYHFILGVKKRLKLFVELNPGIRRYSLYCILDHLNGLESKDMILVVGVLKL